MSSSKSYLDYALDQLSLVDGVSWCAMMGEYILYLKGVVIGGVYDDRLLLKPTPSAERLMPEAVREQPYPGAKEMLLVDALDDRELLKTLIMAVYQDLSLPPEKKKGTRS